MELELGGYLVTLEKGHLVGIHCPKRRKGKVILQERISLVLDGHRCDVSPKNLVATLFNGANVETCWDLGGGYTLTRRIQLFEVEEEQKPGVGLLNLFEVSQNPGSRATNPRGLAVRWTFWDRGASHKVVIEPPIPVYAPRGGVERYREEYLGWRYRRRIPFLRLMDKYSETLLGGERVTSVNSNGWLHLYPPANTVLMVNRAVSDPGLPDYVITLQKDVFPWENGKNCFRVEMVYVPLGTVEKDRIRECFLVGKGSWLGSMVVSTLPPSEKSLLQVYDATNRLGQYKYEIPTPVLLIDPEKIPRIASFLEKLGEIDTLWVVEPTDLGPTLELLRLAGKNRDVRVVGSVENRLLRFLARFHPVDMVGKEELPLYFWRHRAESLSCGGGCVFDGMVVCDHDPVVAAAASLLGKYLAFPVLTVDGDNVEKIKKVVSRCSPSYMVLVGKEAAKIGFDRARNVLVVGGHDKFDVVANLSDLFLKILFLDQILFLLRESCVEWWNNPERSERWEVPKGYTELFERMGLKTVFTEVLGFVERGLRVPGELAWQLYRNASLDLLLGFFKHCLMETFVVAGGNMFSCHEFFHASRYSYLRRAPLVITPDPGVKEKKHVLNLLKEIDNHINVLHSVIREDSRKKLLVELETIEKRFHKKGCVLSGETGGRVKRLEKELDLLVEKLGVALANMLHPAARNRLEKNRALYHAFFLSDHSIPWETLKLSKGYLGVVSAVSRLSGVDPGDTSILLCRYLLYENLPKRGEMKGLLVSNPFSDLIHAEKEEESVENVAKNFKIFLEKVLGSKATKSRVLEALRDEHDVIHFVCHTSWDGCSIELFDGFLSGEELIRNSVGGYPVVFVNACGSARGAGGLSGLASCFLHGGAIGFLGSLWDVRDIHAAIFADVVYGSLLRRDTLGMGLAKAKHVLLRRCGAQAGNGFIMYGDPVLRLLSSMGQDIVRIVAKLVVNQKSGGVWVSMCFERFSGLVAPWPRVVVGKLFLGCDVEQLRLWDDWGELEHSFDPENGFLSYVERVPSFPGSVYRFSLDYFLRCGGSRGWAWCFGWDREAAELGDAQYSWFRVRVGVVGGGVCRVVVEPRAVIMAEEKGWTRFELGVWSDQSLFVKFLFDEWKHKK
ncbi:MAG: hypothetical protein DRO11_02520 [Methanobacteriota archaeon]|nr:MAG: hypothetical protein DRO11_02520 [Euryarchaeota archaeon]